MCVASTCNDNSEEGSGKFPGEGKAGLGLEVGRMYTWQGEKRTRCAELDGAWQIQRERQVYQQGV